MFYKHRNDVKLYLNIKLKVPSKSVQDQRRSCNFYRRDSSRSRAALTHALLLLSSLHTHVASVQWVSQALRSLPDMPRNVWWRTGRERARERERVGVGGLGLLTATPVLQQDNADANALRRWLWRWLHCGRAHRHLPPPTDQLSVRRSVSPSPCLSVCPSVSLSVSGCLEQCKIKNCNKLQAKRQINYKIEERERPRERKRRRKGTTSECKKLACNGDVMPPLPTDEKEFSVRIWERLSPTLSLPLSFPFSLCDSLLADSM